MKVDVKWASDKALFIKLHEADFQTWIPRSVVENGHKVQMGERQLVLVAEWFYDKNISAKFM